MPPVVISYTSVGCSGGLPVSHVLVLVSYSGMGSWKHEEADVRMEKV